MPPPSPRSRCGLAAAWIARSAPAACRPALSPAGCASRALAFGARPIGRAVGRALRAFRPAAPGLSAARLAWMARAAGSPRRLRLPRPLGNRRRKRPGERLAWPGRPGVAQKRPSLPGPAPRLGRPARARPRTQTTATGLSPGAERQRRRRRGGPRQGAPRPATARRAAPLFSFFYRTSPRKRGAPPAEGGLLNPEPAGEGAAVGHPHHGAGRAAAKAGAASEPVWASVSGPHREGQSGAFAPARAGPANEPPAREPKKVVARGRGNKASCKCETGDYVRYDQFSNA